MHRRLLLVPLLCLTWSVGFNEGHLIDGIFTEPTLKQGYNLVATVPRGALAVNVTELRHTQNYLAIRLKDGNYLLNGNFNINWSGEYKAAGTTFIYLRQSPQNLESFSAVGPLHEPIDVMVLYQEPNPGIVYRYVIPGNTHGPTNSHLGHKTDGASLTTGEGTPSPYVLKRYKKRKFAWKPAGYTECNKSCGGGIQTLRYVCIREHTQAQVPDKRCHALDKPKEIRSKCNSRPCPAKWRAGGWSECSVSCGTGVRSRELECVQEVRPSLLMRVADGACLESSTLPTEDICSMPPCQDDPGTTSSNLIPGRWNVGFWSECSTSCGLGMKTRTVTCLTYGYSCESEEKPLTQEPCDLGPCPTKSSLTNSVPAKLQTAQWLYTEWSSQCSAECGTGVQTRRTFCEDGFEGGSCDQATKPETSRACSSNKTCSGQWFAGPWTDCSSQCDVGEQTREAVCVTTLRGSLRVVLDMNCPANKPEIKRPCRGPPCTSMWFISDWLECSRSCGKGTQRREVRCFNPEGQAPEPHQAHCRDDDRPVSRRTCNDYPCRDEAHGSEKVHRAVQIQNDPEISNGLEEHPFCKDNISNCNLVTQARLCTYKFYQQSCCQSCLRAKQEFD